MSISVCSCCNLALSFDEGTELLSCPACGTVNARPKAEGPSLDVLRRAITQRLHCDFANAEASYQRVLLDFPEEHEALWGRLLCRYGVEYVVDPATNRRVPVVHTVRAKPMQEEGDFRDACAFAPDEVRTQYEAEAAYIDAAMLRVRQLAAKGQPYDVFICHKTTTLEGGGYTQDYARASDLYHLLTSWGLRVFFAPKELDSVAGENYEAGIYHALTTAKTMLVVCSDPRHLSSPWVMNEWQRFLEMADEQPGKRLIPLLYGEMAASDLPREFRTRGLQAMIMGEMGAQEKLLAALAPAAKPAAASPAPAAAPSPDAARHASIHKLLDVALWDEAQQQVDACLAEDPTDAQAHLYQLLIELKLQGEKDLAHCTRPLENMESWQNFVQHADAATYDRIMGYRKAAIRQQKQTSFWGAIVTFAGSLAIIVALMFSWIGPYSTSPSCEPKPFLSSIVGIGLLLFLIFFFALRKRETIVLGSCISFGSLGTASFSLGGLITYFDKELLPLLGNNEGLLDSLTIGLAVGLTGLIVIFSAIRVYRFLRKPI